MKWRSKVTGTELAWVRDSWEKDRYVVTCSFVEHKGPVKSDSWDWLRLPYSDFVEAFERVEDEEPIREGMYDGWDTE
jgi:hypothetical protein